MNEPSRINFSQRANWERILEPFVCHFTLLPGAIILAVAGLFELLGLKNPEGPSGQSPIDKIVEGVKGTLGLGCIATVQAVGLYHIGMAAKSFLLKR